MQLRVYDHIIFHFLADILGYELCTILYCCCLPCWTLYYMYYCWTGEWVLSELDCIWYYVLLLNWGVSTIWIELYYMYYCWTGEWVLSELNCTKYCNCNVLSIEHFLNSLEKKCISLRQRLYIAVNSLEKNAYPYDSVYTLLSIHWEKNAYPYDSVYTLQ